MATCNENCACGRACLRQEQQSGRCNHDCRRDDCPVNQVPRTCGGCIAAPGYGDPLSIEGRAATKLRSAMRGAKTAENLARLPKTRFERIDDD